jgi:hypothetical protein
MPEAVPCDTPLDVFDAAEWMKCARRGELEAAWQISDRIRRRNGRTQDPSIPRHLQSVWNGSDLRGRRVLIRCYHGLGDTIQFIRYAPLVASVAAELTVWAQPALLPLLRTVAGIDRLVPLHDGAAGVEYDVDAEIMELPYIFRTTLSTVPAHVPYLSAEPSPSPLTGPSPRVGIVWRAGEWDERRSIPFEQLDPLFRVPRISWYSLQQMVQSGERHDRVEQLAARDALSTSQWMQALDLIVSVDTMPAHLAGALGRPVWTLLAHDADWRWMMGRADTPWYPTMRLFRQHTRGDWVPVIAQVATALRDLTRSRSAAASLASP